jgi:predicted metal-dependent hydrolase
MPLRASEKWLHSVLQDRAHWVVEKLAGWQARQPEQIHWADGGVIRYLGEPLTLRVAQSLFAAAPQQRGCELWLFVTHVQNEDVIKRAVTNWYKNVALRLFNDRVSHYATLLNVAPRVVKLSNAKTQWGCCTARGTVRLNLQLVKLPLSLVDYVVVHELAHLREMNHSAAFWAVVATQCPDYAARRKELRRVSLLA